MRTGNEGLPPLSEAQLEIMNVVWERGSCTVSEVVEALNKQRPIARNTVLTVMTRLSEKGWLIQETVGRAHRYVAARKRASVQKSMVRRLLDAAFGGNPDGLIMAMVDDGALSAEDLEQIRRRLDEQTEESK